VKDDMFKKLDISTIGLILFGLASTGVLIVAIYKSEIVFSGIERARYVNYFIISILGIMTSTGSLFLAKNTGTTYYSP
jgi:hypothetical protein